MKKSEEQFDAILSNKLRKVQYKLVNKKYGALAVLFVKCISMKELSADRLRIIQPVLILLSGWVKVSTLVQRKMTALRNYILSMFEYSLLLEIALFVARGMSLLILTVFFSVIALDIPNVAPAVLLASLHLFLCFGKYKKLIQRWLYLAFSYAFWIVFLSMMLELPVTQKYLALLKNYM